MTDPEFLDPLDGLAAIFRDCTDPDAGRYDLGMPWIDGNHVYATDGRILVRCPAEAAEWHVLESLRVYRSRPGPGRVPRNVAELFRQAEACAPTPTAMPEPEGPESIPCDMCAGTGRVDVDEFGESSPGTQYGCHACEGEKSFPNNEPVAVAPGYLVSARIVRILRRHGCRVHLPPAATARVGVVDVGAPLYFAVDDCEGLAMPMRSPTDREAPGRMSAMSRTEF